MTRKRDRLRKKFSRWKKGNRETLDEIYHEAKACCTKCGIKTIRWSDFPTEFNGEMYKELATFDHTVPLIKGGENKKENLRLFCLPCDSKKGSK